VHGIAKTTQQPYKECFTVRCMMLQNRTSAKHS